MGDSSTGDRIRAIRKRRGMTQERLAEAAGLSVNVIKKLEQGGSARMETLHQIGRALGVVTVTFMTADSPQPVEQREMDDLVLADMRAAINPAVGFSGPIRTGADDDKPDLGRLRKTIASVAQAYHHDQYDTVATLTPEVVRSTHHHVAYFDHGQENRVALELRSDILGLAGRYLVQVRAHDLALIALRDALNDALEVGSRALASAAISSQAWAMLRQGRFAEVEQLCAASADEIEPRMSNASSEELTAWGNLLLRASAAAARNNRPEEAREFLSMAGAAGMRLGQEYTAHTNSGLVLGPLKVALMGVENELVAHNPARALELTSQLPQGTGQVLPATWHRHQRDKAHAYALIGDIDRATELLVELRRKAPEWLKYQQAARDAARVLLRRRPRTLNEQQRELADFLQVDEDI